MYDVFNTATVVNRTEPVKRVSDSLIRKTRRPGRYPTTPDDELDMVEYQRRERRRERNRTAAARCRDRRVELVSHLQAQVDNLVKDKDTLKTENANLQAELERLRFQLATNQKQHARNLLADNCVRQDQHLSKQNYTVSFTPLSNINETFSFPHIPKEALEKARNVSCTEFNKILTVL